MSNTDFRATINFQDDKLVINSNGAFYFAGQVLRWSLPLDRAERVFDAALRSVQVFNEVEGFKVFQGSGSADHPYPSGGSARTAAGEVGREASMSTASGAVEHVALSGGGAFAPSPALSCSCGLTSPCRCEDAPLRSEDIYFDKCCDPKCKYNCGACLIGPETV